MMLNNKNMQISILEFHRESIITLLNKLHLLFDSKHLKSRDVYVAIECLRLSIVHKPTIPLGTDKQKSVVTQEWLIQHECVSYVSAQDDRCYLVT